MKGTAVVKKELNHTEFLFGDKSALAGREFPLIDIVKGDHLCLFSVTGIIAIDERDVESVNFDPTIKPIDVLLKAWDSKDLHELNTTLSMYSTRQTALNARKEEAWVQPLR